MNGYAFFGRAPVLCSASIDLDSHLADEHRAELRSEAVNDKIEDAIFTLLASAEHNDLDCVLQTFGPYRPGKRRTYRDLLDSVGLPNKIDNDRDWQRLIHLAPLENMPMIVQAYRDWAMSVWADDSDVRRMAEKLADEQEAQDRADYELARAGIDA